MTTWISIEYLWKLLAVVTGFLQLIFITLPLIFLIGLSKNVSVIAAAVLMFRNPWRYVAVNVGGGMPKLRK